jgi:hypothetical protein
MVMGEAKTFVDQKLLVLVTPPDANLVAWEGEEAESSGAEAFHVSASRGRDGYFAIPTKAGFHVWEGEVDDSHGSGMAWRGEWKPATQADLARFGIVMPAADEIERLKVEVASLRAERDGLRGLIVRPWTREGDGKRLWAVNLAALDLAESEQEAWAIVAERLARLNPPAPSGAVYPEGEAAPSCPRCKGSHLVGLPLGMLGWLCTKCGERVAGGGQGSPVPSDAGEGRSS